VEISVFQGVVFDHIAYDLMVYPLWVDAGVKKLQELLL
jgi:hypothetical protein